MLLQSLRRIPTSDALLFQASFSPLFAGTVEGNGQSSLLKVSSCVEKAADGLGFSTTGSALRRAVISGGAVSPPIGLWDLSDRGQIG